jgi:hypothetical protein
LFPTLRAENKTYEEERKKSNALSHRKHDLEAAIANLQLGPLAPRVHAIIDRYIAALPAPDKRNKHDLTWQLALHRMDFRQYNVADTQPAAGEIAAADGKGPPKNYIRLEPKPPAPEVQQLIDESTKTFGEMNARLGVYMWGLRIATRGSTRKSTMAETLIGVQQIALRGSLEVFDLPYPAGRCPHTADGRRGKSVPTSSSRQHGSSVAPAGLHHYQFKNNPSSSRNIPQARSSSSMR